MCIERREVCSRYQAPGARLTAARFAAAVRRLFGPPLEGLRGFCGRFRDALKEAERSGAWRACFEAHERELVGAFGAYARQFAADYASVAEARGASAVARRGSRVDLDVTYHARTERAELGSHPHSSSALSVPLTLPGHGP